MQIQQTESTYDTFRLEKQIQQNVIDGTIINTESQYMELKQLEDVYDNVKVSELEVSCRFCRYSSDHTSIH